MRRRNYYRVKKVYPKQKWLINNNEITILNGSLNQNSYVLRFEPITQNPTRTTESGAGVTSSATVIKVGRFRYNGVINLNYSNVNYIIGIAYIPEGYTLTTNTSISKNQLGECFFYKHPEWVLAWTRMDYISNSQENEIRLYSKLKRNLNSGDGIVLFMIGINNSTTETTFTSQLQGTVSYVCRTN